jgi:hypothetical protein
LTNTIGVRVMLFKTTISICMRFNRKIWQDWDSKKPCPKCEVGVLDYGKKSGFIRSETEESKHMNSYGGYSYSDYVFSVHLNCNNCNETVVACGFMSEENYPSGEEEMIKRAVTPIAFYPAPKIIHVPSSCPQTVKNILEESFGLYWLNLASCANKIRVSIEVLLTELNIPLINVTKNGKAELSLHRRLEKFSELNPNVAQHLIAIKWIGNAGSHFSELKTKDVLDAYELVEFSLDRLYNDNEKRLIELSKEINKNKKPTKK